MTMSIKWYKLFCLELCINTKTRFILVKHSNNEDVLLDLRLINYWCNIEKFTILFVNKILT